DIMRDNLIINPSGHPGHAIGVDMNIEHHIGQQKSIATRRGIHGSWDRLGDIAACGTIIRTAKRALSQGFAIPYSGNTHKMTDSAGAICKVTDKVHDRQLQASILKDGVPRSARKVTTDLIETGQRKLAATIQTFNKKF
ncbi:hypothetical protein NEOLEDRAFT_1018697, partial [Neolentinus lepideus HHB14362 ss-1]